MRDGALATVVVPAEAGTQRLFDERHWMAVPRNVAADAARLAVPRNFGLRPRLAVPRNLAADGLGFPAFAGMTRIRGGCFVHLRKSQSLHVACAIAARTAARSKLRQRAQTC